MIVIIGFEYNLNIDVLLCLINPMIVFNIASFYSSFWFIAMISLISFSPGARDATVIGSPGFGG